MRIEQQVGQPDAVPPVETKPKPGEKPKPGVEPSKVTPEEPPPQEDLPQLPETD